VRATGRVVRFDKSRGYGFIAPDIGGDDVFLHVNDLEMEESQLRRDLIVSFEIEDGERGKFATAVRLHRAQPDSAPPPEPKSASDETDEFFDIMTVEEFNHLATEMLLHITPALTGEQILKVRESFSRLADKHGWIDVT
jgi:cold shock protein